MSAWLHLLQRHPEAPLLVDPQAGLALSRAEVASRIRERAGSFVAGRRVALVGDNSVERIIELLAAIAAGALPVLLHPRFPPAQRDAVAAAAGVGRAVPDGWCEVHEAPALVLTTSGSTGRPKLVVHSWPRLLRHAEACNARTPFGAGDAWRLSLPLCHVGGLGVLTRALVGTDVDGVRSFGAVVVAPPTAQLLAPMSSPVPITHLSVVARQLTSIVDALEHTTNGDVTTTITNHWRCVMVGGGPTPPALLRRAVRLGVPVCQTYGLTELGSQVCTSAILRRPEDIDAEHPGSGAPLDDTEVSIVDGVITVRGPGLLLGRIDDDDPDRLHPQRHEPLSTGDLGTFEQGQLRVLGRADNRFISGGENVQPEEIERVLSQHPSVHSAVVVPVDDPTWGEVPVAFVETAADADITAVEGDLRAFTALHLPVYARPRTYYPMETTGALKPQRADLRREAARRWSTPPPSTPSSTDRPD